MNIRFMHLLSKWMFTGCLLCARDCGECWVRAVNRINENLCPLAEVSDRTLAVSLYKEGL